MILGVTNTTAFDCEARASHRDNVLFYGRVIASVSLVALSILFIGLEVEQWHVGRLPGTAQLYETEQVCGLDLPSEYFTGFVGNPISLSEENVSKPDPQMYEMKEKSIRESSVLVENKENVKPHDAANYPPLTSVTYASAEIVRSEKNIVQHCGNCGQCSNPQDLAIYDDTRNTLFHSTLQCSLHALTRGRQAASECLQQAVGFTEGCNDCWVDNIMCDTRKCVFTCTWTAIISKIRMRGSNEDDPQQLNACLQCDERRCGPAFLQCAGANRRRAGILSDIRRNPLEVCQAVDEEWWRSESLQTYYKIAGDITPP